ncbi:1748_t:CDS:1, partial [Ambispora leptoticha]
TYQSVQQTESKNNDFNSQSNPQNEASTQTITENNLPTSRGKPNSANIAPSSITSIKYFTSTLATSATLLITTTENSSTKVITTVVASSKVVVSSTKVVVAVTNSNSPSNNNLISSADSFLLIDEIFKSIIMALFNSFGLSLIFI